MTDPGTDPLSALTSQILRANPDAYQKLVVREGTTAEAQRLLGEVRPEQLLAAPVSSPGHAAAMLAGLWLWHDALNECHEIAQKSPESLTAAASPSRGSGLNVIPAPPAGGDGGGRGEHLLRDAADTLNFWHAIMHRREGDFSNAKYWYARCRNHPALQTMGANAGAVINPLPADKRFLRLIVNGWNPDAFVDLIEAVSEQPDDPRRPAAVALQQLEWRLLFDHCTRAAAGA